MQTKLKRLAFSLAIACFVAAASQLQAETKIVFLAGTPSHGYGAHEHLAGSRVLASAIEKNAKDVNCEVYSGGWPDDESVLDDADAIVMYCDGGGRHPALKHLDVLEKHIQRGAGFCCLHYGVEVPKEEGGEEFLRWLGGYFETNWSVNPHWVASFESFPNHPVASGVKPFRADDEWYFHMRFVDDMKGVTPILSAVAPASTMNRKDGAHSGNPHVRKAVAAGTPQHVAWIYDREDGGRSFGFTGGHYHWNWGLEAPLKLVCNAILWSAGGDVPKGGLSVAGPSIVELEKGQDEKVSAKYSREATLEKFGIE